jgi:hypothetical protein
LTWIDFDIQIAVLRRVGATICASKLCFQSNRLAFGKLRHTSFVGAQTLAAVRH